MFDKYKKEFLMIKTPKKLMILEKNILDLRMTKK